MALARFTGLRAASSVPDAPTMMELARIQRLIEDEGNTLLALRSLRGMVTSDPELKRAWELGVQAFDGIRYDYVPPTDVRTALAEGRRMLMEGNRAVCLRIARQLVSHDPELKQGWQLGLSAFTS